ncbi:hypothetical protein E4U41_006537 [Claviceps citrina]|nr:hypothetical protein E4U41_006537 [Claviceps citrina]
MMTLWTWTKLGYLCEVSFPKLLRLWPAVCTFLLLLAVAMIFHSASNIAHQPPLANPPTTLLARLNAKRTFIKFSKEILLDARRRFPQQPFRLRTDWGDVLVLPPEFANEIRNDPRLSFGKAAMQN